MEYNTSCCCSGRVQIISKTISSSTLFLAFSTSLSVTFFFFSLSAISPALSNSITAVLASPDSCAAMAEARFIADSSTAPSWNASFALLVSIFFSSWALYGGKTSSFSHSELRVLGSSLSLNVSMLLMPITEIEPLAISSFALVSAYINSSRSLTLSISSRAIIRLRFFFEQ